MPDDAPPSPTCRVCRMDDHGNTFVVRDPLTRGEAEQLAAEFTARGHKRIYWVERSSTAEH